MFYCETPWCFLSSEALSFLPPAAKPLILGGVDEAVSNELGLGELAGLTVANEADAVAYEVSVAPPPDNAPSDHAPLTTPPQVNNADALRKSWSSRFTLRSHFDPVRCLAFHPVDPVLVTASEDRTLKLWNLHKTPPTKK